MTPVITAFNRTGSTYHMSITDPSLLGFQPQDINISILGVQCVNMSGTLSNFTCSVPTNSDGSAALPAGN